MCYTFQYLAMNLNGRHELLRRRGEIEGLDEFIGEDQVGKMAMLLGRRVVGLVRMSAEKIEDVIMEEVLRG